MNILIMGGTEFVSSSLAKHLIYKGYRVDIFTRGIRPVDYSGVFRHHRGNRRSIEDLERNIGNIKYDYVFDISAYSEDDVNTLFNVLDTTSLKRYIFCSSGAVYKPSDKFLQEDFEVGENSNWGDYGLNKLNAESYLMNLYKSRSIPIVIFRTTYIYGRENNLYREVYIFDRLTRGLSIPIPDGSEETQFIYIDDFVRVFESAMCCERAVGQIYNITYDETVTWEKLVSTSMEVANIKVDIKKVKSADFKSSREYFPFRNYTYLLDRKKSIEHGLYIPKINLFQGLKLSYKWYREANPRLRDEKMNRVEFALLDEPNH